MIGYKAFDENLMCRGFQFEIGKTYETKAKKEELENNSLWQVSKVHNVSYMALRTWLETRGVTNFMLNRPHKLKPTENLKPCKRTGEAHDMIKFLATRYTLASIGRVFGYSKERIRQIVNEEKPMGMTMQELSDEMRKERARCSTHCGTWNSKDRFLIEYVVTKEGDKK